jgi:starch phosphorylase
MRLLVDEHGIGWETAWTIIQQCFGYTNHTLMP